MQHANKPRSPRIAIIGAGMAGVSCAHALRVHGYDATVFEKSRGIGGRLSTRRNEAGDCFDHGAQYVTTKTPEFAPFMAMLQDKGAAAPWQPAQKESDPAHRHLWWVGTPGMNALLKPLTSSLHLRTETTITALHRINDHWQLKTLDDAIPEPVDIVISTTPADQARALLAAEPTLQAQLEAVAMAPCWALMLTFRTPLEPGFDAHRFDSGATSWLARQASRPGHVADPNAWVLHASAQWSAQNLEMTPDEAAAFLKHDLARVIGHALPVITFEQAHRWRYAMTTQALDQPFVANPSQNLFVGGDWCLGARVECAYQSGTAIADAVAQRWNAPS